MAGPARRRRRADTAGIPRHVLTARAAVVEEGDEGPASEVERRPDQEERHVEVWRLPAKQRIVLGCARGRSTSRDRAGRGATGGRGPPSPGASRRSSPRSVAARSPILPGSRTGSARRRARRGPGSERTGTTRATRRRTASDSPPPESRRPPRPAGRTTAPMTGMRFHGCPGGIVACSGRSATRSRSGIIQDSRSSTLRAPRDSSSFPVADGSNRGSHDSIEMKKASSVTRSKTLDRKSGW